MKSGFIWDHETEIITVVPKTEKSNDFGLKCFMEKIRG